MNKILNIFRQRREKAPILIVSGLPRSGTSMMMMMLEATGIPSLTDQIRTADDDNPRGYYEFERVKKLKEGDFDWLEQANGKVVKVISALLMHLPASHTYRVLFMRRAIPEVLASQRKMLVNRGADTNASGDEEMTRYFKKHLAQIEEWLENQPNISVLYVDYNRLLQEPEPGVHQINIFLGNTLDEAKMIAAIDPRLYRQRH